MLGYTERDLAETSAPGPVSLRVFATAEPSLPDHVANGAGAPEQGGLTSFLFGDTEHLR
ncbi:MAG TPA: hypothetical protein VFV72_16630 [Candidatus Limnocylindrales bacterium]|nr:hypothetical protein [Candidatus Limnocylindrales bacterium]